MHTIYVLHCLGKILRNALSPSKYRCLWISWFTYIINPMFDTTSIFTNSTRRMVCSEQGDRFDCCCSKVKNAMNCIHMLWPTSETFACAWAWAARQVMLFLIKKINIYISVLTFSNAFFLSFSLKFCCYPRPYLNSNGLKLSLSLLLTSNHQILRVAIGSNATPLQLACLQRELQRYISKRSLNMFKIEQWNTLIKTSFWAF